MKRRHCRVGTEAKILIIGLSATEEGAYERQLGNVAILSGATKMLKDTIPSVDISTNFQLTEAFCKELGIKSIRDKEVWSFSPSFFLKSICDLCKCTLWRFLSLFRLDVRSLVNNRKLREYRSADIILDMSADLFSDNFDYIRMLKHSIDILSIRLLRKPVIIFAQSPGPFRSKFIGQVIKSILNKTTLITTREEISKDSLLSIGVSKTPIFATACPAFLFEATSKGRVEQIFKQEGISLDNEPLIGLTFCSFNISVNPMRIIIQNKWLNTMKYLLPKLFYNLVEKRMKSVKSLDTHVTADLMPFAQAIDHLVERLHATVLLIPHMYESSSSRYHILSDKGLAEKLCELTNSANTEKIKILKGKYNAEDVKGIIGECDIFISGRMHAAIAAMTQNIPTIVIPYGNKFYGIMQMVGQQICILEENNTDYIISKIDYVWRKRGEISKQLEARIPEVRERALLNAKLVDDIINEKESRKV